MRVVFLDFDGVLNDQQTLTDAWSLRRFLLSPEGGKSPDEVSELWDLAMIGKPFVDRVQRICDATGAVVVLSTSWRILNDVDDLRRYLADKGLRAEVVGATPRGADGFRGREIDAWLRGRRDVESFVILDDGSDMDPYLERLVQTECDEGIQDRHVERAIDLLTRYRPPVPTPEEARPRKPGAR